MIAGKPSRTSYSRFRRLPGGLAGPWWPCSATRASVVAGRATSDLDYVALLKGVVRREFDVVAAWSVCRLGRSLSDLFGLLGELRAPRFNPGPTCDLSEGCPDRLNSRKPLIQPDQRVRNLLALAAP